LFTESCRRNQKSELNFRLAAIILPALNSLTVNAVAAVQKSDLTVTDLADLTGWIS